MSVKLEKEGFCGKPTIRVACVHTKMGKGGFWGMSLAAAKKLHSQLGRVINKAGQSKSKPAKKDEDQTSPAAVEALALVREISAVSSPFESDARQWHYKAKRIMGRT